MYSIITKQCFFKINELNDYISHLTPLWSNSTSELIFFLNYRTFHLSPWLITWELMKIKNWVICSTVYMYF